MWLSSRPGTQARRKAVDAYAEPLSLCMSRNRTAIRASSNIHDYECPRDSKVGEWSISDVAMWICNSRLARIDHKTQAAQHRCQVPTSIDKIKRPQSNTEGVL